MIEFVSSEERALVEGARQFAREQLLELDRRCDRDEGSICSALPQMAEMGFLALRLPEQYHGLGCTLTVYAAILHELAYASPSAAVTLSVHNMVGDILLRFGSERVKSEILPGWGQAENHASFAISEADAGSDPSCCQCTAVCDSDHWIINGSKMWITNGTIADLAVVWAMTDEGLRGFLVEKDTDGYTTRDIEKKYSLRASVTSELFFDNVRVPEGNMLPNVRGLKGPLGCLTQARYGIAWGAIGSAIACFREVLEYSKVRVLFDRPLSHTQTVQRRLADMCRRITTAQLMALQLGRLKDQGRMHHSQVSLAKWNNVRMALDIARDARDLLGASGISIEFCPIRHMLNLESVITYEGTETIHELIVGRELTGHNAF